jgi:hypothetical protein
MCLVNFVDVVSELSATPIFKAVNLPAIFGDHIGIPFDHARYLFRLVRMDHKDDFVVSH